jgi:multifunctional methyltransferase subunit TRM112
MMKKILYKTNISALQSAAKNLAIDGSFATLDNPTVESLLESKELLSELHNLLFEIHVQDGELICPESGRRFPIKDGIPNLLLHEDEV